MPVSHSGTLACRQPNAELLKVARSTLYYRPSPVNVDDLRLMRWLDEQFLKTPFYGTRRMVAVMRRDGLVVNRKRVKRLMRLMGIEAIYQSPIPVWDIRRTRNTRICCGI